MSGFATTTDHRYFEDYVAGSVHEFGTIAVEPDEVVSFGRRFVPLSYHTDAEAAKKSIYGGLIASGWHTCSIGMRLTVDSHVNRTASLGSPGLDNIRWLKPVRAGDTISYSRIVLESRASESRPGVGLVKSRWEAVNQAGETVMTMEGWGMFGRRPK